MIASLAIGPFLRYPSKDDWHTTTQNMADEPSLANETPVPEQIWLLHTSYTEIPGLDEPTSGMPEHNGKGLKALAFTISEIPHSIFSKHIFQLRKCLSFMFLELQKSLLVTFQGQWTQWQRFESSSIYHFWDTPLHFLKTCFSLESGCAFVPRAPEIPTSMFSGKLNTMAKVWKP